MTNEEMHETFAEWNKGDLDSYLIEITRDILAKKDEDGNYVLDYILDTAGQKGTGKWTAISALDEGVPLTLISESVYARCLSAQKDERVVASGILEGPKPLKYCGDRADFLEDLRKALFAAKVVSYAQGFTLMRAAAKANGWDLNYGGIALLWRGGCIIRSVFLGKIKEAFDKDPELANILLDPYFITTVTVHPGFLLTCFRPRGTISEPIPTSAPTVRGESSSTRTGPATEVILFPVHTSHNQ